MQTRYMILDTESSIRVCDGVRVLVSLAYDIVETTPHGSKRIHHVYDIVRPIQLLRYCINVATVFTTMT